MASIPLVLGAYLLGSVPTAYIMVRLVTGNDIRRLGTRNVGALNTYHQLGILAALPVLLVDAGKGALAVLIPTWLGAPHYTAFLTTVLVVAGHNWPVFLNFRGCNLAAAIDGISLDMLTLLVMITLSVWS